MYFLYFNSSWVDKIRNMVTATLNVCRYTNLSFIWYKPESIIVPKLDKNKSYQGNLLINLTPFLGSILTYYLSYWLKIVLSFPWLCMPCFFSKICKNKYSFLANLVDDYKLKKIWVKGKFTMFLYLLRTLLYLLRSRLWITSKLNISSLVVVLLCHTN